MYTYIATIHCTLYRYTQKLVQGLQGTIACILSKIIYCGLVTTNYHKTIQVYCVCKLLNPHLIAI